MVTNFLNFARPERLSLLPLALEPVVRKAVHDVDPEGAAVVISGDFGEVDGDEALLRQAFSNLVRNAIEACRDAGIVPHVEVRGLHGEDGVIEVTVGDNGPGLPASGRDRLFQPFFTTRQDGTGLGLALVLKFIVTHNGQVRAGDRPGGGALFSVRLPARGQGNTTTS
jgi:signal transduction histidine kinase